MAISTAFEEVSEILGRLEGRDIDIHDIALDETGIRNGDQLSVDLGVSIPVLADIEGRDGVSIDVGDIDLHEEDLVVELTATVPTRNADAHDVDTAPAEPEGSVRSATADATEKRSAYKDPEALRAVYEEYDTFPKMTNALDVDVTSETVRRHMVKYGIHTPPSASDGQAEADTEGDSSGGDVAEDSVGTVPVADALAATERVADDETLRADGLGIRQDLTIGKLADIVNRSRTVYETQRRLDTERELTRRFLEELDLLEFVTGRLSSGTNKGITPAEIWRRIDPDNDAAN